MTREDRQRLRELVNQARREQEKARDRHRQTSHIRGLQKERAVPRTLWTKETIAMHIRAFVDEHGRPPTMKEWEKAGPHPAPRTVKLHFGSWVQGMLAAGVPPRPHGARGVDLAQRKTGRVAWQRREAA